MPHALHRSTQRPEQRERAPLAGAQARSPQPRTPGRKGLTEVRFDDAGMHVTLSAHRERIAERVRRGAKRAVHGLRALARRGGKSEAREEHRRDHRRAPCPEILRRVIGAGDLLQVLVDVGCA